MSMPARLGKLPACPFFAQSLDAQRQLRLVRPLLLAAAGNGQDSCSGCRPDACASRDGSMSAASGSLARLPTFPHALAPGSRSSSCAQQVVCVGPSSCPPALPAIAVRFPQPDKMKLLQYAAGAGNLPLVQLLLGHGCKVKKTPTY